MREGGASFRGRVTGRRGAKFAAKPAHLSRPLRKKASAEAQILRTRADTDGKLFPWVNIAPGHIG